MALSFSQVGMALASGAFQTDYSLYQRQRRPATFTKVNINALLFVVVVCLLYAALGAAMLIAALVLRRTRKYAQVQGELRGGEKWDVLRTLKDIASSCWGKIKQLWDGK
ncbi:hypothetical protein NA57DRAFT_71941 [Rhizodiscina lignyota]|uniref:Uncharacterized protein n=1 Tax=Rhizodiscina lignyota TaxID=1504668 RepID=A0A9P4MCZ8_9PEZI|nr:hypothetical protein NA57DRAFT_71941 [Rhizodiscina lignyota]